MVTLLVQTPPRSAKSRFYAGHYSHPLRLAWNGRTRAAVQIIYWLPRRAGRKLLLPSTSCIVDVTPRSEMGGFSLQPDRVIGLIARPAAGAGRAHQQKHRRRDENRSGTDKCGRVFLKNALLQFLRGFGYKICPVSIFKINAEPGRLACAILSFEEIAGHSFFHGISTFNISREWE
jgi:hypothetical protein